MPIDNAILPYLQTAKTDPAPAPKFNWGGESYDHAHALEEDIIKVLKADLQMRRLHLVTGPAGEKYRIQLYAVLTPEDSDAG